MAEPVGKKFGRYRLIRKLATGGMGEVYLARLDDSSGIKQHLVIKRILAHHLDKPDYLEMFTSEARLVAGLDHPNIVRVHEMNEISGDYYIAMEYVRGRSLRDLIEAVGATGRDLPLPYIIELAIQLCEGLGYAHNARDPDGRSMNIVHRDINPHNVLVSYSGLLKIIDFGIAKSDVTRARTATGTIKGKFVYMSPEQSAADPLDGRSDLFSLGILLYEMCCLENPFVRQNVVLSLEAIQRHAVVPPSRRRPDAAPLDAIVTKALVKSPEGRFQTAYELRNALRRLVRSGEVQPARRSLGSFLHEVFASSIAEEDQVLANLGVSGSGVDAPIRATAVDPSQVYSDEAPTEARARAERATHRVSVPSSSTSGRPLGALLWNEPTPSPLEVMDTRRIEEQALAEPTRRIPELASEPLSSWSLPGHATDEGSLPLEGGSSGRRAEKFLVYVLVLAGAVAAGFVATRTFRPWSGGPARTAPIPAGDSVSTQPGQGASSGSTARRPVMVSPTVARDDADIVAGSTSEAGSTLKRGPVVSDRVAKSARAGLVAVSKIAEQRARAKARPVLGTLLVNAQPSARVVRRRSERISPARLTVRRRSSRFLLEVADGVPDQIAVTFTVLEAGVALRVETKPWTIVKSNGLSLGKTPREVPAAMRHRLEFVRPGQGAPVRVALDWEAR